MADLTIKYVDGDGEHEFAVPIGAKPEDLPAAAMQLLSSSGFLASDGTVVLPYDEPVVPAQEPPAEPDVETPAPSDVTE